MLSPADFADFLYPRSLSLTPTSASPQEYCPPESERPGYPANPRMLLPRLYMQEGVYLDYYTGQHDPSLSRTLRQQKEPSDVSPILLRHKSLFPQLSITKQFVPTLLVHGTSDTAVRITESRNLLCNLRELGCSVSLIEVPHAEHSFDFAPNSERDHGHIFQQAVCFLKNHLLPP
jgi:acetyl esterase/lipase